jgi:NTE family protein
MLVHATSMMTQHRMQADIGSFGDLCELVVLPPPCPLAIQPVDFNHADELMQHGYVDSCDFLDGGGAAKPPIRMRMHRHERSAVLRS